jgi:hypothetical protein
MRTRFTAKGTKKFTNGLKGWAPLGAAVAIGLFVLSQYRDYREFRERTDTSLKTLTDVSSQIDARLHDIEITLARVSVKSLDDAAASSPEILQHALPILRKQMGQEPKAEITSEAVQKIAATLEQVPETSPEYWPTVLQFIQFASTANAKNVPPPGSPLLRITGSRIIGEGAFSPKDHVVLRFDGGEVGDITFQNSRIIFTEHPVKLHNVRFIDCFFEMPNVERPNPYLQKAAKGLLASQFKEIKEAS